MNISQRDTIEETFKESKESGCSKILTQYSNEILSTALHSPKTLIDVLNGQTETNPATYVCGASSYFDKDYPNRGFDPRLPKQLIEGSLIRLYMESIRKMKRDKSKSSGEAKEPARKYVWPGKNWPDLNIVKSEYEQMFNGGSEGIAGLAMNRTKSAIDDTTLDETNRNQSIRSDPPATAEEQKWPNGPLGPPLETYSYPPQSGLAPHHPNFTAYDHSTHRQVSHPALTQQSSYPTHQASGYYSTPIRHQSGHSNSGIPGPPSASTSQASQASQGGRSSSETKPTTSRGYIPLKDL